MSKDKIIIISTHIVSDIEYISDQVLIMKKGKFILQGPADELLKEVKNEVWSCRVPNNQWSNFERTHCIANSHVMKEVIEARVISTSSPIEGAIIVEPTLEDLYLKLFLMSYKRKQSDIRSFMGGRTFPMTNAQNAQTYEWN